MESISTAKSQKYRCVGVLERLGTLVGAGIRGPLRSWLKAGYNALRLVLTGGRGYVCQLPGGEMLRILPECSHVSWNPAEYDAFKAAVSSGCTALDIGANVGCYALLLGRWAGPTGRVFAFEPAPEVCAALRRHISMNALGGTIEAVCAAVADHSGEMKFSRENFQGMNRLLLPGDTGVTESSQPVRVLSVDDFCAVRELRPDFMKIDVEGFELAVLRGARATIREGRDRLAILVELHPSVWPSIAVTKEDILAELKLQELDIEPLEPGTDPWTQEGVCARLRPQAVWTPTSTVA